MLLIQIHKKVNRDFQGVYKCETCHGVRIDEGLDSYDDAYFYENVIPEMPCYLCDKEAPLSKRYLMALDTLAWPVKTGGCSYRGEERGFPSFDYVWPVGGGIKDVKAYFHRDGQRLVAKRTGCGTTLDAEELVSRVIADLAAQGKEAK